MFSHLHVNSAHLLSQTLRRSIQLLAVIVVVIADLESVSAAAQPEAALQEARHAFAKKDFERTLALVEPLLDEKAIAHDARRIKIRSLVRLSRPVDALAEYDRLVAQLTQDERPLLRDLAIGFVTSLLKDMREQMRGAAYTALKEVESDDTISFFEDGVSDGSGLIRTLAVEGLGRLPAGRRSPSLNKAMEDQAAMVRAATVKVLGRVNDAAALATITRALKDEQGVVRVTAAGVLAARQQDNGWERLTQFVTVNNPEERATALRMLGETKDSRALPILKEALKDTQPSVRGAAAAALGNLQTKAAVPFLVEALNDRLPAVRAAAIVSLGEVGAPESVSAVRAMLQDVNLPVRAAAVATLLQLGVPYTALSDVVEELASSVDPGARSAVARALSKGKTPDAAWMLESMLSDPLPRPRIAAARSLGQIGGNERIPVLKNVLHDQDEAVRATAGGALARILSAPHAIEKKKAS